MLIFAHRGASGEAPENTLQAIELALEQKCDGVEIDIHQVEDEFVVIHDRWLQRTTNGSGLVCENSVEAIRSLDAGKGQAVPTLKDVISCIGNRCTLNIEIKGVRDPLSLIRYLKDYASHQPLDFGQLLFSSFDHHQLQAIHAISPEWRIGALTGSKPLTYAAFAQQLNAYSVNIDLNVVDRAFIEDAKQRGLSVYVYTVDEPEDLLALNRLGADGVFTNYPARARDVLSV